MTRIFQWTNTNVKQQAGFKMLKGVDSQWAIDISEGRELPGAFPAGAYFEMNPDRPKEDALGEQYSNRESMVVLGPRLSQFVRQLGEPAVQLLPVKVHDLKGKVVAEVHVVHTARRVDCVDAEASGVKWNPVDPDSMMSWKTLTLKPGDHDFPRVFRIEHIPGKLFVREDLAHAIEALGIKGPYFTALPDVS